MKPIEKRSGYFTSFDGTSVYFETHGSGQPLLLCYGIVCTTNHWRHQIRYFSQNYQVILIDYRGHHRTGVPVNRDNLSIDGIAQDIRGLFDHLKVDRASLWGHSFGCQVLVRTYDMFPELFHNLVLINGFASNPIKGMMGTESAAHVFKLLKEGYEQLPETLSYLWKWFVNNPISIRVSALAGGFNLSLTSFKDIEIYGRGVANIDIDVFIKFFDQMMTYDGRSVLDRISVPTLIIGGTKDKVTPAEFQRTLYNRIKGSELVMVPYGTHCTQLDMPTLVNLSSENFLRRVGYPP